MKSTFLAALLIALILDLTVPLQAAVVIDDTWADGSRNDTAFPNESAWFASTASQLTASSNSMVGTVGSSSATWWTYFAPPGEAVSLNVGETLTATLEFIPDGVAPQNSSRGLRIGLFDFSNGVRRTSDGGVPGGTGVTGYLLNLNFGSTFGVNNPLQLMRRTNLASSSLLSTSGDFTSLGMGGGNSGDPAFSNGTPYTLEFQVKRLANGVEFTARISNGAWSSFHSVADPVDFNSRFDAFALRPNGAAQSASSFRFTRFKVESDATAVAPTILQHPLSQVATQGQNVTLSVSATGTAPLSYQWFRGGAQLLPGQTNSDLTLPNVQPADAGTYYVIVSNRVGSITSDQATLGIQTDTGAPLVSLQPRSQTVRIGQTATFAVSNGGSEPFFYRWFFNQVPLPNATNRLLNLPSVQPGSAGSYQVAISNHVGSVTSVAAILTVNAALTGPPAFNLVGFAGLNGFASNNTLTAGGTQGGSAGSRVQAATLAELVQHLESDAPLVIEVMNDIDLSGLANHSGGFPVDYPVGEILVRSHKTLYSKIGATLRRGTLRIGKASLGPQQNIIIRNLRFRDLWVLDPSGNYDTYGWDYIHMEEGSHHIWVDHCDFGPVYDGAVDATHACDFITVSWNAFSNQKKSSLIGHSDSNGAEDRSHFNVTFHHNWYRNVDERMPRMRFGNAHVFNTYCENLGGKGIQSTASAATLVENVYFLHPLAGSAPTVEANGGPTGTVKVVNSVIVNRPGVNVQFREFGAGTFAFNPPFASATPPYPYLLDPVENVPNLVTNYAGVGKIGFELWQMEQFSAAQLTNQSVSGPGAAPAGDGVPNLAKYALGLSPFVPATKPLPETQVQEGTGLMTYRRSSFASDLVYRVLVSSNLFDWTEENVIQYPVSGGSGGLETWQVQFLGPPTSQRFFWLRLER